LKRIYLDHNATTPVHPSVLKAMLPYLERDFGNPSSLHYFGRKVRASMDKAREKVASLIGVKPEEIIFTSCGTESNNLALKGIVEANRKRGNHIITSSIEHPAVLNVCKYLSKQGCRITYLPVDRYGLIDPKNVKKAITKKTILVSIIHANNEMGTIQPLREIGRMIKKANSKRLNRIYFHSDTVQSVGKIEVNVNKLGVDLLSLSGHKLYGPKGIGALYIRKGTRISSLLQGGEHEYYLRAGTENVSGIIGLGKACEIASRGRIKEEKKLFKLSERLYQGIRGKIPDIRLNGHPAKRLPGTLNISFESVEGEALLLALDLEGIAVSTGSACASGSPEPSHVLLALGLSYEEAYTSLRFSLGRENTEEEIDYVLKILPGMVKRIRAISAVGRKK